MAHTVIRIVMCEVTVTYAHALHDMQLVQPPSWFFPVLFHSHCFNPLKPELNPICYLLALLGAHHFLHVSRIRVIYIYGAPILDVSRSHTTTQHIR